MEDCIDGTIIEILTVPQFDLTIYHIEWQDGTREKILKPEEPPLQPEMSYLWGLVTDRNQLSVRY